MRKLTILLAALLLTACGSPSAPPPSLISRIDSVREIKVDSPGVLAVDQQGRLYAATRGGVIKIFDQQGREIGALASQNPAGKKILAQPAGLAIFADKIYVTDSRLHTVSIFSLAGEYLESFGKKGSGPKEFSNPAGIDIYRGVLYVADSGNKRIQLFGENGVFLRSISGYTVRAPAEKAGESLEEAKGSPGESGTPPQPGKATYTGLAEPVDLSVDFAGNIHIVDARTRQIVIINQQGELQATLPDLSAPGFIKRKDDGFLVVDKDYLTVRKLSFAHTQLFTFGARGKAATQFLDINGIDSDDMGNIYVADARKNVIQVFRHDPGEPFPPGDKAAPPVSVKWQREIGVATGKAARDGEDALYAVVPKEKAIVRIEQGAVVKTISIKDVDPVAVAVDREGSPWVLDQRKKRVLKLDREGNILLEFGSSGRKAGNFSKPTDIVVYDSGIILVADSGNGWVQSFNAGGMFLSVIRETAAAAIKDPIALDLDDQGNLYVLDGGARAVHIFSAAGKPLFSFGQQGKGTPGYLHNPVDLFAAGAEIFILDAGASSVKVFSPKGEFLREFGTAGSGKGDFSNPVALTPLAGATFAVSDTGNNKIQFLTTVYTPEAPRGVAAKGGMRAINLTWDANPEPYLAEYTIYRATTPESGFQLIGRSAEPEYLDSGLEADTTYYYRIAAVAAQGNESPFSPAGQAGTSKFRAAPPAGLEAAPSEWAVRLSWDPSPEQFTRGYRVYRQTGEDQTLLGETQSPEFTATSLAAGTEYLFLVSALSSDEVESDRVAVKTATRVSSKQPLEIEILEMMDIFANTYKLYEDEGLGRIKITNNTGSSISRVKVSFTIRQFMDFPASVEFDNLEPGKSEEYVLKAVFNNNILEVTEDTPVQTEIRASYFVNNEEKSFDRTQSINIYEKHRMLWDERGRFATFITPKDPLLLEFARSIITQYADAGETIQKAAALFGGLGALGVIYQQDPSNPYQVTSGITDFVDYIQYPRETLQRKSGDCDDLVALYASALESIGITTMAVEFPGHMLMMFATGIEAGEELYTMNDMFVIHQNMLWVPIETTLVGKSFITAWEKGSSNYYAWKDQGLTLFNIAEAWERYKPASLPASAWKPPVITRDLIESTFHNEFASVRRISLQARVREYMTILESQPDDESALQQIGIIYARAGETGEAMKAFTRIIEKNGQHAGAVNNLGNIHFLEGRLDEARAAYEKASQADPDDPLVLVNLARCYLRLNLLDQAKTAFLKAGEIDPEVNNRFRGIALKLMSTL